MRKFSFGKENDHPIPQKNSDDFNDLDELDFEEDMETEEKNEKKLNLNEKRKSNDSFSEEVEINSQIIKNSELKLNSESDEDDSDKNNSENGAKKENKKNEEKEDSIEDNDERDKNKKEEEKDEEKKEESEEEKEKDEDKESEKDEDEEKKEEKNEEKDGKKEKEEKNNKKKKEESEEDEEEEEEDDENEEENKKEISEKDPFEGFEKNKDKEIENILLKSIKNKENATSERIQMAEKINFKSIPDKIIATDQYGFIISEDNNNQDKGANKNANTNKSETDLLQINARMEKWNYMIEHYDEFKTKNFNKLKSRTRKGIPDSLRSYIWQLFGEKDKYYEKDLFSKLDKIPMNEDTVPACQFFKEKYGNGQRKLYKVLSYYSKYNTDTGYVQGMGFIVAVFLTYMDEESSFFMLHSLMKKYNMEGFYLPGFPILKKTFYILLNLEKKFLPKIYELFKKEGMIPSMYASEWFICLFSRNLEFKSLVRIFDIFLLEGYKVIYRFALAFLKLKEDKFMEGKDGLASIMQTINECTENVDIEKMFKIAFGFSISRNFINQLGTEFEKIKDDPKNEFVKQL